MAAAADELLYGVPGHREVPIKDCWHITLSELGQRASAGAGRGAQIGGRM